MPGTINPALPSKGDLRGASDAKVKGALIAVRDGLNNILNEENEVPGLGTWYTPKVIATEETRTNTAFGTMPTADEIANVAVPSSGLLIVGYSALFKSSVPSAGRAAIFIGDNQLKVGLGTQEALASEVFKALSTYPGGLVKTAEQSSFVTTGEALGFEASGGFCVVQRLPAGTYPVGIRYKATSGSVTVKERALYAWTLG